MAPTQLQNKTCATNCLRNDRQNLRASQPGVPWFGVDKSPHPDDVLMLKIYQSDCHYPGYIMKFFLRTIYKIEIQYVGFNFDHGTSGTSCPWYLVSEIVEKIP
jgi:hypothetical protein